MIKKHVKQKHVGKPGGQGEDVDDIISVGDMFEDKTSSIQIDHDSIDRLIEEHRKDLLDDDEDAWLFDEEEAAVEDNMVNQLKEMEDKYNIGKENNKVLQKRMSCLEEKNIIDDIDTRTEHSVHRTEGEDYRAEGSERRQRCSKD